MNTGDKAPEFTLPGADGSDVKLTDFSGGWVLLYFYPKDFTSGCTTEACSFRDNFDKLSKKLTILGVSADSSDSHAKFIQKYKLPFLLLSDKERKVINLYGATGFVFTKRVSFLIAPKGYIKKIYNKVNAKTHATQILSDVEKLTQK